MIDFHSHVLPLMDDGSHNLEESIQMLKMSYEQGVDTIIFTPHFRYGENEINSWLQGRDERVQQIRDALSEEEKKRIPKIILGAEVEFYKFMNRWDYLDKLCIKGTNYIMTEMPFTPWTKSDVTVIDEIALNTPYTPIIPHIDRYFHTFTPMAYIEHFYNMPVIIQMNAIYINGVENLQYFKPLLDEGRIQVLGSDCHSAEWRQPDLGQAVERLNSVCAPEVMERIEANGRKIIEGAIYEEI